MPSVPSLDPATGKLRVKHIPDLPKTQVGLGNVNNTSDADKPVSTATSTAINAAIAGQVRVALWDGNAYKVGNTVVTSNNRPGSTFYKFVGGPDPFTLNLGVINGDEWKDAS